MDLPASIAALGEQLCGADEISPDAALFSDPNVFAAERELIFARPLIWKLIGVAYPIAVLLTIVVTGNHYVFDALMGYAVMAVGFLVTSAWTRRGRSDRLQPSSA